MEKRRRRIITVTSGKGGVGKSSIVSNLAYMLSSMNERTFILDADLALGNIDIMFGMIPKYNMKDLINGGRRIEEIVMEGPCGIKIIPATSGVCEFANLSAEEKNILFASLQALPEYDFLIVDTSAGISSNVISFNAMSEDIFVVVTPDPSSITDSYAVIKVLEKKTGRKDFNIVVNMVKDEEEALEIFKKLINVSDRFLDVYLSYFGCIPLDVNINQAIKRQRLWVEHFPETVATKALSQICSRLVS
ncbi:MAG: Flagellum site-determining protein YlxH [Syntrophorhabdus sp. PtaU1.Bin058]|nr:MAG: Flagellum site-determining protein YlxH [Syntrophorhabdus sp. PtaU1.Bin058]